MGEYIVSARKYRPVSFDSVVGQSALTTTLKNAVKSGKLAHAYLFCGPRGVGKTTCARIFAKAINCLTPTEMGEACNHCESCQAFNDQRSYNIFELDAASNNSVENIKTLMDQTRIPPQVGKYKVFIIDEVHMLSTAAFNAFLKTLEEPPAHVIFILATTEKHKILPTILSRCQIYDFERMSVPGIINHLKAVAEKEGIAYEEAALNVIAEKADGGMRDALSILDQCTALAEGPLTTERVQEALGLVGHAWIEKMAMQIADCDAPALIAQLGELLQNGRELKQILGELAQYFRSLMIVGVGGTVSAAEFCAEQEDVLREEAKRFTQEKIMTILRTLNETVQELRFSPQPRIAVETMFIALCRAADAPAPQTAEQTAASNSADTLRIARLEAQIAQLTARLAAGGAAKNAADRNISPAAGAGAPPIGSTRMKDTKTTAPKRAAASKAAPPVPDNAPRQLDAALWKSFQVRLKERNKLAASLLSGADYEGMTETHFFIRPSSDMARDYIGKRHRAVFEEVMTELAGHPVVVVCTGGEEESAAPPPAEKRPEYPEQVTELLKIAGEGARVEEVTAPVPRRAEKAAAPREDASYGAYEPTPDEEAEMFDSDELPDDDA